MPVLHKAISGMIIISCGFLFACNDKTEQLSEARIDMPEARASQSTAPVESALTQFIDASINRRHAEYYDLLSSKDQSVKTKEKYLEEQQSMQPNLADHYFHRITFKIQSVVITGEEAKVEVLYNFPDVERMIKQVYNVAVLGEKGLPGMDEMKQRLDFEYQNKPLPVKSKIRNFVLHNENNEWRVYLGWDKAK